MLPGILPRFHLPNDIYADDDHSNTVNSNGFVEKIIKPHGLIGPLIDYSVLSVKFAEAGFVYKTGETLASMG